MKFDHIVSLYVVLASQTNEYAIVVGDDNEYCKCEVSMELPLKIKNNLNNGTYHLAM